MRLIICAKDLGFTEVCTMGAIDAMDHGCVSAAAVYLNMPGTEYALRELSKRPHISLVWQVSDRGRQVENINAGSIDAELDQEIRNCIRIYGKAPCAMIAESRDLLDAAYSICARYGIAYDWMGTGDSHTGRGDIPMINEIIPCNDRVGVKNCPCTLSIPRECALLIPAG